MYFKLLFIIFLFQKFQNLPEIQNSFSIKQSKSHHFDILQKTPAKVQNE